MLCRFYPGGRSCFDSAVKLLSYTCLGQGGSYQLYPAKKVEFAMSLLPCLCEAPGSA